jgi:UbiD family decarboxylase
MAYRDLREYMGVLQERGKLHHVTAEVDKDWEIAAVCRRVFQKIPARARPVLVFDRVKGFEIPILVGSLGASPEVYSIALQCAVGEIGRRWEEAQLHPVKPERVASGPCKEVILRGEEADLLRFPVPIWTVEHDPGPYITAPCIVTKDPDTGSYNVGTYRLQVKGKRKLGLWAGEGQDIARHRRKYEGRNQPTPVAIALGPDPTIEMVSVTKFPPATNEYDIAGGLRREPVSLVACETVPLEVPATAEIVIEGEMPPGYREHEGPFGEYTGYMGAAGNMPVVNVTCITHRRHPIYRAFFSQMPPSESSCIRRTGREQSLLKHLKDDLGLPVIDLHLLESTGAAGILVISLGKHQPWQTTQVIHGAWALAPAYGKIMIIVDDDIDVHDHAQVEWAMGFRMQPERDVEIVRGTQAVGLDPSLVPPEVPQDDVSRYVGSKLVIKATRKHAFPPLALPPEDHLKKVDAQWGKYGLPPVA